MHGVGHSAALRSSSAVRARAARWGLLVLLLAPLAWAGAPDTPVAPAPALPDEVTAWRFDLPPRVDGDLGDWPEADGPYVAHLGVKEQALPGRTAPWDGPDDLSARVLLGADADAFYLAAHVRDDQRLHPGEPWWNGDSIELFLDLDRPTGGPGADRYGPHCFQIFLMPRSPEESWGVAYRGTTARFDDGGLVGVQVVGRERPDGYDVEARIPWRGLGEVGTGARDLGFDLALNDADEAPGDPGTYLSWNGKFDLYRVPSNFGVLHLPPRPPPPAPAGRSGAPAPLGGIALVVALALFGLALLAGPGSRVIARVGPPPKLAALGLTGLLALLFVADAERTRARGEDQVRTDLGNLAKEADEIARAAADIGALPVSDPVRRARVLRDLLRGAEVPCVLPTEAAAFVPLDDLARRATDAAGYDLPLDRPLVLRVVNPTSARALVATLALRWLPARDEARTDDEVLLGTFEVEGEGLAATPVPIRVSGGAPREVEAQIPLPHAAAVDRLTWTPAAGAPAIRLHAVVAGRSGNAQALWLAPPTVDGVPILGGPGVPDLDVPLAPGASKSAEIPFLLGAERLWLVLAVPDAFPRLLGEEVVARVTVRYDEGPPTELALVNGEHVAAERMPSGIPRPPDMASRVAYRWTDERGSVVAHDAVPVRLDPARRARRVELANVGAAGPLRWIAASVVRSLAPARDAPLGVASGLDGADRVFVRRPDARFTRRLGPGAEESVRIDREVGPPLRAAKITLSAPVPPEVVEKRARTQVALLTCLAIALLLLAFLAADAVERFRRLTLRLAFGVLVAALVPLATVIVLVDRTTATRLENEQAARAREALAVAERSLGDVLRHTEDAADNLAQHILSEPELTASGAVGRLVRLYRASALPAGAATHAIVASASGPTVEVPGETPETSLSGPRFLAERSVAEGLHLSPWDGALLVASRRRGRPDGWVRVTLGARLDDRFLAAVALPDLAAPDVAVALLDADGTPLAAAGPGASSFLDALARETGRIARDLSEHQDAVLPHVATRDHERLAVITPLATAPGSTRRAWLAVGLDRRAIDATLTDQREQLAWVSLFGVLLVVGVASLTARRVAQPVRGLVRVTEAVRRGEFDVEVPPAGTDEVGDLTVAFDQMRLDLKHRVADLDFLRRAQDALAESLDYGRRARTVLDLFDAAVHPDAAVLLDALAGIGPLAVTAERGRRTSFTDRAFSPAPGGWLEAALRADAPVEVSDPAGDPRVEAEGAVGPRLVEGREAWLAVPLRAAGEPVALAVLAWDDPAALPRGEGRRLLEPLAGTCALALHNARLYRLAALDDVTRLPGATAFEAALRADVERAVAGGPAGDAAPRRARPPGAPEAPPRRGGGARPLEDARRRAPERRRGPRDPGPPPRGRGRPPTRRREPSRGPGARRACPRPALAHRGVAGPGGRARGDERHGRRRARARRRHEPRVPARRGGPRARRRAGRGRRARRGGAAARPGARGRPAVRGGRGLPVGAHGARRRGRAPRGTGRQQHPRHGRDRDRQGGRRERHPPAQRARREAVREGQLRGVPRDAARERAVRTRAGRVHGCRPPPRGPLRARRRGHALPRRDRRDGAERAGEAPARPAGAPVHAPRRDAPGERGRADHRRDEPRPRGGRRGRDVPGRPLLPPERDPSGAPAAPRAP